MLPVLHLHICLRQLVVGVSKPAVHLSCIAVLDDGFAVLALIEITLTTLQIFLLAHVRIARASREKGGQTGKHKQQTNQMETLHYRFSPWGRLAPVAAISVNQ